MFGAAAAFEEVSSAEGGRTPCARWRATVCRALRTGRGCPVQLDVNLAEPLLGTGTGAGTDIGSASDPALDGRDDGRPWTTVGLAERVTGIEPPAFAEPSRTVVVVGDAGRATGAAGPVSSPGGTDGPSSRNRRAMRASRHRRSACTACCSGAAHGPAAELTAAIERVVVVGHPTLSRPVSRLLARTDLDVVVCGPVPWTDVAGTARLVLPEVPAVSAPAVATAEAIDADWLRS